MVTSPGKVMWTKSEDMLLAQVDKKIDRQTNRLNDKEKDSSEIH